MGKADLRGRYGPWAVIAGASEGLGAAFAEGAAARGLDVVLLGRRREPLAALAASIAGRHQVATAAVPLDLASESLASELEAAVAGREVGLLVYNAAFDDIGPFLSRPLADHRRALSVNCLGPLTLVHQLAGPMAVRRKGGVVLMSSLAGFVGSAYLATYAATKAFNLVWAEGLAEDLRAVGVDVVVSCAGAVLTPGYAASAPAELPALAPAPLSPEVVVDDALAALGQRSLTIPGRGYRWASWALRRLMSRRQGVRTMSDAGRAVFAAAQASGKAPRS